MKNLGDKVQRLQRQLEAEIRNKVRSMEGGLMRQRSAFIEKWMSQEQQRQKKENDDKVAAAAASDKKAGNEQDDEAINKSRKELAMVLHKTGPNCPIRRAVIAHQYNFLRLAFLSTHNRYSIWMMMQSSHFFTESNKRRHNELALAKHQQQQQSAAVHPQQKGGNGNGGGKVSAAGTRANSKQIGEEIFNKDKKSGKLTKGGMVTCEAGDMLRNWPLYCHEIVMTMEQEDRIINQAHAEARNHPNLHAKLNKMNAAINATHQLQNAMLCHTQLASQRNETLLLEILTPAQTALFLDWSKKNKERLKSIMERQVKSRREQGMAADASAAGGIGSTRESESTLAGVYRQLEEMRLEGKKSEEEK